MLNLNQLRQHIQAANFSNLFLNELEWDYTNLTKPIVIGGATLTAIAEKRGFQIFICEITELPTVTERKTIAQKIGSLYHEHLIIYFNADKQIWQIAVKELNKPIQYKEIEHHIYQEPDLLISKLRGIFFSMSEEGHIHLIDVTDRINNSFNSNTEKTTKKFYDHFKKQHAAFMALIHGLENADNQRWYASLMLNRLMFIYFIQKKGFLDNDVNYLRVKLNQIQKAHGDNQFYSFYRNFLLAFFHDGLGKEHKNNKELVALIGNVPYLNGGLFDVHELEKANADIQIADSAFTQLFDFFDQYQWHLDNSANAKGNEINPDVIGYIFEKYINDRAAMGAYYTKEDITEYISKNTIIPFLFDNVKTKCAIAFKADSSLWQLLKQSPDRYIYDAVKKGCDVLDIPENIAIGIDNVAPNLLERRKDWNSPTPELFGLPTEIWRETIARRQRYFELKTKLENGEITELNDFITHNLNIRQFAQDALEFYEGSDFIEAFYNAIVNITVLDPTCGSGAFLFAALNILEPLYETCIKRMREFIDHAKSDRFANFRAIVADIDKHQHPTYWIYKKIILNNLYGVDIMPEAVEIAKLRLFLKLAAMAEANYDKPNLGLEPLPDIDFNIRCGNTLIGYTTHQQIKSAIECDINGQVKMVVDDSMVLIDGMIEELQGVLRGYKANQLLNNSVGLHADKQNIKDRLAEIKESLDFFLARDYGIDNEKLAAWKSSHQPFHWFTEFFHIINNGGFDVIIGNPPYVEYSKVKGDYLIKNYETESCGNLYGFVMELSYQVLNKKGLFGMIIPISAFSNKSMETLQQFLKNVPLSFISNFHQRPAALFDGVLQRLSIFIGYKEHETKSALSTPVFRWKSETRNFLFSSIFYVESEQRQNNSLKIGSSVEVQILEKYLNHKPISDLTENKKVVSENKIYYRTAGGGYWVTILNSSFDTTSLSNKGAAFQSKYDAKVISAVLNSNLFWWYYTINFDQFNFKDYMIFGFQFNYPTDKELIEKLSNLSNQLETELLKNSTRYVINSKTRGSNETITYNKFLSKNTMDEIDKVLAAHYGFTEQELDFIINYDIKYRMGKELD
ncbi:MAG: DNA methyltransferase [Methylococcaceae bacterium]